MTSALRRIGLAVGILVGLILLTFALPIPLWRTGEQPAPPLSLTRGGPLVPLPRRVWIDTDAACGHGRTTDPDDCLAILLLARAPELTLVGISTVHGNAELPVTDSTTRALAEALARDGVAVPTVYRGAVSPGQGVGTPAAAALASALDAGPLTVVGLGPLTNVAAALRGRPRPPRDARLVTVMGRRRGHLFHPGEGSGRGMLFGHGPVFSDFNFEQDPTAAVAVLRSRLPLSLVPYEAAREVELRAGDLERLDRAGGTPAWVSARARGWLDFWRTEVGRHGFFPFDLVGAAYLVEPTLFDCARVPAWIAEDDRLWRWFGGGEALLVGLPSERPDTARAAGEVVYCPEVDGRVRTWLLDRLT